MDDLNRIADLETMLADCGTETEADQSGLLDQWIELSELKFGSGMGAAK